MPRFPNAAAATAHALSCPGGRLRCCDSCNRSPWSCDSGTPASSSNRHHRAPRTLSIFRYSRTHTENRRSRNCRTTSPARCRPMKHRLYELGRSPAKKKQNTLNSCLMIQIIDNEMIRIIYFIIFMLLIMSSAAEILRGLIKVLEKCSLYYNCLYVERNFCIILNYAICCRNIARMNCI